MRLAAEVSPRDDGLQGTVWRRNWVERQLSFVVRFSQPVLRRQQLPARAGVKAPRYVLDFDLGRGRVRGPRGAVMAAPGGVYYSTLSLRDTFRASHPLFTLVVPERAPGFVNTMLAHHRQMGLLPRGLRARAKASS